MQHVKFSIVDINLGLSQIHKYIHFCPSRLRNELYLLDVILDVSQLTRMVLLKQQQHQQQQQQQGVPGPLHGIQRPTVIWERGRKSRSQILKVQNQCGVVNNTFNKVMSMKM